MLVKIYIACLQTRGIPCLCTNAMMLVVVIRSVQVDVNNHAYIRKNMPFSKLTIQTLSVYHWRPMLLFIFIRTLNNVLSWLSWQLLWSYNIRKYCIFMNNLCNLIQLNGGPLVLKPVYPDRRNICLIFKAGLSGFK